MRRAIGQAVAGLSRLPEWARVLLRALVPAFILTLLALSAMQVGIGTGLQRQVSDALFPRGRTDDRLLVVAIDQASTNTPRGRGWGFPQLAAVVDRLHQAGARSIVLGDDGGRLPDQQEATLPILARAMLRAGNVTFGLPSVQLAPSAQRNGRIPPVRSASVALAVLYESATASGATNVEADPVDQVVRSVPLAFEESDGTVSPHLVLAALVQTERLRPDVGEWDGGIDVGDRRIRTDRHGDLQLNWSSGLLPGHRENQVVSALDLLQDEVPSDRIRGRTVLVGLTDPAFAAMYPTPVGELSAILVHAQALNTMLTEQWLTPAETWETLLWIVLLTWAVSIAVATLPLWLGPVLAVIVAAGFAGFAALRAEAGSLMDLVHTFGALAGALLVGVLLRGAHELRERRRVTSMFSEYVPAGVVAQLVHDRRVDAATRGERLDVVLLFCDLRGFTALAESLEPHRVRDVLNAYYELTTRIVFEHRGTVLQYVGDEVFAVFGAPIPDPGAAAIGLRCANALQAATAELNSSLAGDGLPPVSYGIGLHEGEVIAAHVGNRIRRQYAVVGDPVNVGSRLCGQARAGEIVASDAILSAIGAPPDAEPLGPLPLKGKREPVEGFRLRTVP